MIIGDRVIISKYAPAWQGEIGIYVGDENTLIGKRCKVELDNGFSGLFSYKDLQLATTDKEE